MRTFVVAYFSFHDNEIHQDIFDDLDEYHAKIKMLIKMGWDVDCSTDIDELADMCISAYEIQ